MDLKNWFVISRDEYFYAIDEKELNSEDEYGFSQYNGSEIFKGELEKDKAIQLAIKLNNAINDWEAENGL